MLKYEIKEKKKIISRFITKIDYRLRNNFSLKENRVSHNFCECFVVLYFFKYNISEPVVVITTEPTTEPTRIMAPLK
jgi:hypothetical protein